MQIYIKLVDRNTLTSILDNTYQLSKTQTQSLDTNLNLFVTDYVFDNTKLIGYWGLTLTYDIQNSITASCFSLSFRSIARKVSNVQAQMTYYFFISSRLSRDKLENKYYDGFILENMTFYHNEYSFTINEIPVFDRYPLILNDGTVYSSKINVTYTYTGYQIL